MAHVACIVFRATHPEPRCEIEPSCTLFPADRSVHARHPTIASAMSGALTPWGSSPFIRASGPHRLVLGGLDRRFRRRLVDRKRLGQRKADRFDLDRASAFADVHRGLLGFEGSRSLM